VAVSVTAGLSASIGGIPLPFSTVDSISPHELVKGIKDKIITKIVKTAILTDNFTIYAASDRSRRLQQPEPQVGNLRLPDFAAEIRLTNEAGNLCGLAVPQFGHSTSLSSADIALNDSNNSPHLRQRYWYIGMPLPPELQYFTILFYMADTAGVCDICRFQLFDKKTGYLISF
jgi:hypothetical protein